nr:CapA family protein [Olsenella profusa]
MVGDVLVHPSVWKSGERADGTRSYDHLFEHVADDVAAADIAMLDQETLLGGDALGLSGYPVFNGPQEIGDAEAAAGFDVALHANNHVLDKGMEGIEAELAFWRGRHPEMVVTGMADSEEVAAEVPVLERAGHRVAILNYATNTNGIPLPQPWSVRMIGEEQAASDVAAARAAGAEAIVACPHWGTEYAAGPDAEQLRWAQVLADAGADVIIGNHPHVMQPFEVFRASDGRGVPLLWSTGNFVSGQDRKESMIGSIARATLSFTADGARVSEFRVTPLVTNKAGETELTTYRLADYTEELALGNGIRSSAGCADFTRQWCVDFCAGRLGEAFDPEACELVWRA